MLVFKYVLHNLAHAYGKTVTFMPKPLFGDNGSGMHVHQSLWKTGKPLFSGDLYAGLSQMALWYIGGLLRHARALSAIIAPTTNSYKRLVPGYEAPVNLAYSRRNRSAACRIPMYSASQGTLIVLAKAPTACEHRRSQPSPKQSNRPTFDFGSGNQKNQDALPYKHHQERCQGAFSSV